MDWWLLNKGSGNRGWSTTLDVVAVLSLPPQESL
jgi:hypothetical protein